MTSYNCYALEKRTQELRDKLESAGFPDVDPTLFEDPSKLWLTHEPEVFNEAVKRRFCPSTSDPTFTIIYQNVAQSPYFFRNGSWDVTKKYILRDQGEYYGYSPKNQSTTTQGEV